MTEAELDELLTDCPVLYHMAEPGSWPSIRRHGLLSTSALLDLYGIGGAARTALEAERRPEGVPLDRPDLGRITVRDQKPLNDAGLRRCLTDGLDPADWYRLLNARVYFWLSRERVLRLLDAKAYRDRAHEVVEIAARPLVEAYRDRIELSPINSGTTGRFPAPRGRDTFRTIADYPYAAYRKRRSRGERVAELTVLGGVPDIARYVRRIVRMQGAREIDVVDAPANL
ncbi:MAG TPA: hypothetical protein VIL65_12505 [Beijerinckiaceae bacterium]